MVEGVFKKKEVKRREEEERSIGLRRDVLSKYLMNKYWMI